MGFYSKIDAPIPTAKPRVLTDITLMLQDKVQASVAAAVRQSLLDGGFMSVSDFGGETVTQSTKMNALKTFQVQTGDACDHHWMCPMPTGGPSSFCDASFTCQNCVDCVVDSRDSFGKFGLSACVCVCVCDLVFCLCNVSVHVCIRLHLLTTIILSFHLARCIFLPY